MIHLFIVKCLWPKVSRGNPGQSVYGDELSVQMGGKLFIRQAGILFFLGRGEYKRKPKKDMSDNGSDKYHY